MPPGITSTCWEPSQVIALAVKEALICRVLETEIEPPVSWNVLWLMRLLTVCVPEEWVTVMAVPAPTTTSSLVPGKAPVLQFVRVFQSPLPPIHETVAPVAVVGKSCQPRKTPKAKNLMSSFFICPNTPSGRFYS